jgi:hypothetical protein
VRSILTNPAAGERYGVRNAHAAIISRRAWKRGTGCAGGAGTACVTHPRAASSTFGVPGSPRKRSALDWAAIAVEEHGRELAQSFVDAAKRGDWRAAEAVMNRIYGKPEQALVAQVAPAPALELVRSLSLEEKLELLRRLQDGEFVSTASALLVVEQAPRRRSPTHPRERD